MVDEPETPPAEAPPPPELPSGVMFPEDILAQWVAIPESEPVQAAPLTRADWDNFLFSHASVAQALASLQQGLIHFSNGKIAEADAALLEAMRANITGENRARKLFLAIMEGVIKGRSDGSK